MAICDFLARRVTFENQQLLNKHHPQTDGTNAAQGNNNQEESGAAIITDNISNDSEEGGPAGNPDDLDESSIDSLGQF